MKQVGLALVLILVLLGCQKDLVLTGRLNVTFTNSQKLTLKPKIYQLGNSSYPLFEDLVVDSKGNLTKDNLNYGNYLLEYYLQDNLNGGNFAKQIAFQINPEKTTTLTIQL
jgi:hypothetical protein